MAGSRDPVVRDQAGQPGIQLVQSGWQVNGASGELIGEVIERDGDSIVVKLDRSDGDRIRIPTRLIAEEEESAMRATLAVDSAELDTVVPLDDRA